MTNDNWIENQLSARVEAIEAAARAMFRRNHSGMTVEWHEQYGPENWHRDRARLAIDAINVPGLLNDLADRIEADSNFTMHYAAGEWNGALHHAADLVRAAAEGWGDQ